MSQLEPPRRGKDLCLILFTTKGCHACTIAKNILEKVKQEVDIEYTIRDVEDIKDHYPLNDFPTLVCFEKRTIQDRIWNTELWRLEGTYPAPYIIAKINQTINNQNN